jgi:hypothetical protein
VLVVAALVAIVAAAAWWRLGATVTRSEPDVARLAALAKRWGGKVETDGPRFFVDECPEQEEIPEGD